MDYRTVSMVFGCLFAVLYICKRQSLAFVHRILQDISNAVIYTRMYRIKIWRMWCHSSAAMKSGVFCRSLIVSSLLRGVTEHCLNEDEVISRIKSTKFITQLGSLQQISVTVLSLAWQVPKVQTVLYQIAEAILPRLTTCVFSKAKMEMILWATR